ncbi:YdcF family protein [Ramlibacter sp. PS4R-6]|uniref:YdcF family protein n=1 Tax=Ramlibacter sp. PS4R-6 TaxID=3133438 RepID=UPI00309A62AE
MRTATAGGVVGLLLVGDALFLFAQRVFSLGATLPFLFGTVLLALALRRERVQAWLDVSPRRRWLWRAAWALVALWMASVAIFFVFLAQHLQAAAAPAAAPAAIMVLGSGTPGGKVSPVLERRLELALSRARAYPGIPVVVSGGRGFDEERAEAQVMGDWLRAHALESARIVQEEASTSTHGNFVLSRPLLQRHGVAPASPILVVTSDFHALRASWIARNAGYTNVSAAGAPTPLYIRFNAWLREYFAFAAGWALGEFGEKNV